MSISRALGERREVLLSDGPIRWRERGEGEPIVFVHPMVVNGDLWRKVVPLLAGRYRCITPDWPLGGHDVPMSPAADLSPPGLARTIADFLEALDLRNVTLAGVDTGGALAQIVAAEHPERLGRLVLMTCDAFDNFPPAAAKPLVWLTRLPGASAAAARLARIGWIQRSPVAFGLLAKRAFEREIADSYLSPAIASAAVRRDAAKALRGLAPRHTEAAARKLPQFGKPALVIWATEDRFFPLEHGERLAGLLADARLELVDDCYTFMPEDRPDRIAELIRDFAAGTPLTPASASGGAGTAARTDGS